MWKPGECRNRDKRDHRWMMPLDSKIRLEIAKQLEPVRTKSLALSRAPCCFFLLVKQFRMHPVTRATRAPRI